MAVTHGDTPMPVTMTIDAEDERDTAEAMLKAVQAEADKQDSVTGFVLVIMTNSGCVTVGGNHVVGQGEMMGSLREGLSNMVRDISRRQTGMNTPIAEGRVGDRDEE